MLKFSLMFILFTSSLAGHASEPSPQAREEILMKSIFDEIYLVAKDLRPEEEVKKAQISPNSGRRGTFIIEQMKQKNREKLARMRGIDPSKVKSGKDLVKLQAEENKNLLKKMKEVTSEAQWTNLAKEEVEKLRQKVLVEHKEWKKKYIKELQELAKSQEKFSKISDEYQKTLIEIPLVLPVDRKELKKKVDIEIDKDYYLVKSALEVPTRDQKYRPTCSSFSGVRAIEIALAQKNKRYDLSEQYFYWASKDECQNKKCSKRGSWVGNGYQYSQEQSVVDIPLEENCPYRDMSIPGNETQIPLKSSCKQGRVKVQGFKYYKNLNEVLSLIKQDKPVVMSVKLSPNFYEPKPLILAKNKNQGGSMDNHAQGHSILIIGFAKLPKILNEGSLCFITANSWGKGWGTDGHSCLSEKWILEHRLKNPVVVVENIKYI